MNNVTWPTTNKELVKDWSIDQGTRFLIYKADTADEEVYTNLANQPGLMTIYAILGKELWGAGSLGEGDLLEGLI
jgi:hypothetical protein